MKSESKIRELELKQQKIKLLIKSLSAADAARKRKEDKRRKLLIGDFVFKLMDKGGISTQSLSYESVWFAETLKNDRDRELFGLAPLTPKAGE